MADFLDDGEFWLPPKFLADDESLLDHPFGSDLGSPETESDEDDLLSRKATRSALHNSRYGGSVRFPAGSPQSPLPPPATWDLLCEAATEVAKMRLAAEEMYGRGRAPVVSVPGGKALNSDSLRFASQTSVPYHQLLDYQIQLRQQQLMKQHHHHHQQQQQQQRSNAGGWPANQKPFAAAKTCAAPRKADFPATRNGRPVGLSPTAWPSLQQASQPASGMRPVFLGAPAGKRECAGTGVFLPRRAGSQPPPEPRKKPAALLPTKPVHALNMESVAAPLPQMHLHRFNGGDVAWNVRRNGNQNRSIPAAQPKPSSEIRLPQEWTY